MLEHATLASALIEAAGCAAPLLRAVVAAAEALLVDEGGTEQVARRCAAVELLIGVLVCSGGTEQGKTKLLMQQRCWDAACPTLLRELARCPLPHLDEWADCVRHVAAAPVAAQAAGAFDALHDALLDCVARAFAVDGDVGGDATPQQVRVSSIYRYILRESCSQFDSLPLTSLTLHCSSSLRRARCAS